MRAEQQPASDANQPAPRPTPLLGTLLRIPTSALGAAVEQGLHAAGYPEINRSHLAVLQPLFTRPDGARLTDLAAWAHITKPSTAYLVNHLEAHGYVTRTADPVDGRAQRVRLTARGQAAIETVRRLVLETEAAWAGRIGAERLEQLRLILADLAIAIRGDAEPW